MVGVIESTDYVKRSDGRGAGWGLTDCKCIKCGSSGGRGTVSNFDASRIRLGSLGTGAGTVLFLLVLTFVPVSLTAFNIFSHSYDRLDQKYGSFTEKMRLEMMEEVKKMFYFGYDGYMKYAFPMDELDPIHCVGRGPDHENP